jgi:hypothetical protein
MIRQNGSAVHADHHQDTSASDTPEGDRRDVRFDQYGNSSAARIDLEPF